MVMIVRIFGLSKQRLRWRSSGPDERLADCSRKHVVEIKMQLSEHTHSRPAVTVDGNLRFNADLEICADPDNSRIDGSNSREGEAEIISHRNRELCLDNGDEMVDEIRKVEINYIGFQVRHTVLQRPAIKQLLRNRDLLHEIEGTRGNAIPELARQRQGPSPTHGIWQIAKPFPKLNEGVSTL